MKNNHPSTHTEAAPITPASAHFKGILRRRGAPHQRIPASSKIPKRPIIIIMTLAALFAAYVFYGNTAVTVSRYDIRSEKIPPAFDGFRIVQISDLHNSHNRLMTDSLLRKAEEAKPDIIALTGDAIDSYMPDVDAAMQVIERLNQIAPVYYVIGNHEARTGHYYSLSKAMRKIGVAEMGNTYANLRIGDDEIVVAGIFDPRKESAGGDDEALIAGRFLSDLDYDREAYTILLSHRPELMMTYVTHGADLVLTGHAHGGLVRLPGIGGLYAPHQGFLPKYSGGLYTVSDTSMIVNRGVGNSGYSFRINDNPELVIVELHAG